MISGHLLSFLKKLLLLISNQVFLINFFNKNPGSEYVYLYTDYYLTGLQLKNHPYCYTAESKHPAMKAFCRLAAR
jgi:hypothetical protein